mgnify:CR=1 FL=1
MAQRLRNGERAGDKRRRQARGVYAPREFAQIVGVTVHTLQRWDREGRLVAGRTMTNRRYYTDADVVRVLGQASSGTQRKAVACCCVAREDAHAELDRQRQGIERLCRDRGLAIDEWVVETGNALAFQRETLALLIDRILAGEIGMLVVARRACLAQSGVELLELICERAGSMVLAADDERSSSVQE